MTCSTRALGRRIEKTVAWQEGDVWCRVKPDILPAESAVDLGLQNYLDGCYSRELGPETTPRLPDAGWPLHPGDQAGARLEGMRDEIHCAGNRTALRAWPSSPWPMTTVKSLTGSQARQSSCGLSVSKLGRWPGYQTAHAIEMDCSCLAPSRAGHVPGRSCVI